MGENQTIPREEMMRLSEAQIGYLAGIMDGEGSITFVYHKSRTSRSKSAVTYVCAVANSNPLIIEAVTSLLDILSVRYKVFSPKREWNKKAKKRPYAVHIQGMDSVKAFLKVIRQDLRGKQVQAELVLEYLERRKEGRRVRFMTDRDLQIIGLVRSLNKNYGALFPVETTREPSVTAEEDIVRSA